MNHPDPLRAAADVLRAEGHPNAAVVVEHAANHVDALEALMKGAREGDALAIDAILDGPIPVPYVDEEQE
jgi:hypothetical protein